jgi:hypothetical protein
VTGAAPIGTIEIVRGRLTEERAEQLVRFWTGTGALAEEDARLRLPEVVCVLLDDAGEIAGVNSVYAGEVELVGGRRFWIYRSVLLPAMAESGSAMVHAAYKALEADFDHSPGSPVGLCMLVEDGAELERRPEAEWLWPPMTYAGYLPDGRQLRIRYFYAARISNPRPVRDWNMLHDPSYRIDVFADQDVVDADAVIDLWTREGAVSPGEARRRVHEVLLVATHGGREPVAVATAYLGRNTQLRMDLWYFRTFVAPEHQTGRIGSVLFVVTRDVLQQRFMCGHDRRGSGIAVEVEHEGLKQRRDESVWFPSGATFIGENARGDHVRVHYFPGATAPPPPG